MNIVYGTCKHCNGGIEITPDGWKLEQHSQWIVTAAWWPGEHEHEIDLRRRVLMQAESAGGAT